MNKYLILLILPLFLSCRKDDVMEEFHHNLTIEAVCDNGYDDCTRGVKIAFKPRYQADFTVEAYLPEGIDVCGYTVTGFDPYIENVPRYLYFHGAVVPGQMINIEVTFIQPNLPREGNYMTFGRWVTHFDQDENPSIWHLRDQCNLSRN